MTDREPLPPHDPVLRSGPEDELDLDLGGVDDYRGEGPEGGGKGLWVALAVGLVICLLLGYWWWRRPDEPAEQPAVVEVEPISEVGDSPPAIEDETEELEPLPPLNASDDFVSNLLADMSESPLVAEAQRGGDLVRRLAAAVENVAGGVNPAPHLAGLAPKEPFQVVDGGDGTRIDPRSYARFDRYAEAFDALDAGSVATTLRRLQPLLDRAYQDLGYPGESFEETLERAIARLRTTPIPNEPPRVQLDITTYQFVDPDLEALTPAQKILIRMGPDNARRVIRKLGEVEQALESR